MRRQRWRSSKKLTGVTQLSEAQVEEVVRAPRGGRQRRKRRAVVDAATRMFLHHGYAGASMDAIAREAGVCKQTIYNHYASKEALFGAIVLERSERLLSSLKIDTARSPDVETVLSSFARRYLELMLDPSSLALYRLLMAEVGRLPELGEATYRLGPETAETALTRYLEEQCRLGILSIDQPRLAAGQFFGMLKGNLQIRALLDTGLSVSKARREEIATGAVSVFLAAYSAA